MALVCRQVYATSACHGVVDVVLEVCLDGQVRTNTEEDESIYEVVRRDRNY